MNCKTTYDKYELMEEIGILSYGDIVDYESASNHGVQDSILERICRKWIELYTPFDIVFNDTFPDGRSLYYIKCKNEEFAMCVSMEYDIAQIEILKYYYNRYKEHKKEFPHIDPKTIEILKNSRCVLKPTTIIGGTKQ
jgi:hypothetical protein